MKLTQLVMKTQMQGNILKEMPKLLVSKKVTFLKYNCFYIADTVLFMK